MNKVSTISLTCDSAKMPEGWILARIGDLALSIFGGGTPSTKHPEYWDGDQPWTTSAIIAEDAIYLDRYQRTITNIGLSNSSTRVAPSGSILIGTRVGVGKAVVATLDIAINQDLTALIPTADVVPEFLVLVLKHPDIQSWFDSNKRGATIKGIPRKDLESLEIPLPPLPEQRAIAHVLRAVQQAKDATEKVIAATRQLKQSLMRHLFTYGPVPLDQADQVELEETEIGPFPAHWNIKQLEECMTLLMGQSPSGNTYNSEGVGMPLINGPAEYGARSPIPVKWTTAPTRTCKKGDVIFCVRGNTTGKMNLADREYCIGRGVAAFSAKENITLQDYVWFLLEYIAPKVLELAIAGGSTFPNITKAELSSYEIPLPSLMEQSEIGIQLTSADSKLAAEEWRRAALDSLFKCLLHNLMTGKVRVHDLKFSV